VFRFQVEATGSSLLKSVQSGPLCYTSFYSMVISTGIKQLGLEARCSLSTSTEVKNEWI
jgi:hypothetical protein